MKQLSVTDSAKNSCPSCLPFIIARQHHQTFNEISHALWATVMPDRWRKPLGWLLNMILFNSKQNHIKVKCQRPQSECTKCTRQAHNEEGTTICFRKLAAPIIERSFYSALRAIQVFFISALL